jgi:hypothetical protein
MDKHGMSYELVRGSTLNDMTRAMQVFVYGLPRIPLLGTSVNKVNIRPRRGRAAASPHIPPAPVRLVVANSLSFSLRVSACY